ncbi:unnamed protein product [Effrenium voratum]|nr:unnamed protein product [Effrenium voratum]
MPSSLGGAEASHWSSWKERNAAAAGPRPRQKQGKISWPAWATRPSQAQDPKGKAPPLAAARAPPWRAPPLLIGIMLTLQAG